MMGWLNNIVHYGAADVESKSEQRNVVLSNYISIIAAIATLLVIIARFTFGNANLIWAIDTLAGGILFLLPLLLNRLGHTSASRLVLCILPPVILTVLCILTLKDPNEYQTSTYVGVRYFYLSLVCFPFLVFSLKNRKFLMLGLLGAILPLFLFDPILNLFHVGYFQKGLTEETYSYNNIRAFISVFIIGLSCYFLKLLVEKNQDLNEQLIKELVDKNAQIACQNEELQSQQEELHTINQNLESLVRERTEKIEAKNEQIIKYAFTNSHRVRGPVARILGLIALSNLENDTDFKFLFEKIQQEANEMDAITREINQDLDSNID